MPTCWSMSARGQYGPGHDRRPAGQRLSPRGRRRTRLQYRDVCRGRSSIIENWRWAGVPFYLRSGKRLPRKVSEIAVTFKPIPHRFYGDSTDSIEPNVLVIKIEPDEGISMRFEAKVPGPKEHIRSVYMDFNYGTGFGVAIAARVRAADRRCDLRRSDALHPLGRGRARLGDRHADARSLAEHEGLFVPQLCGRKPRARRARGSSSPTGAICEHRLAPVLDELTESIRERGCDANVATMTLVVFFENPAIGELARERIHLLSAKHPSRVIVLDATADPKPASRRRLRLDRARRAGERAGNAAVGRRSAAKCPMLRWCCCGSRAASAAIRAIR